MKMPREDVLNAILTDLLADQIIRALELEYSRRDVDDAVRRGTEHGTYEFSARQRGMEKVGDYNQLEKLKKIEGREALVLYSNLIYRVIQGKWEAVGKADAKGKPKYRR